MNTQTIWETYLNSRQRAAPLKKDRASPSEKNKKTHRQPGCSPSKFQKPEEPGGRS